ncbi:multidrug effflux MFS transporter [Cardiobacteriaceae bacterium TAE3-ERU3]|nr:multidrug effflux MFS transporter [Cardiobacteriaceae bacterium TAE3-ERU3]
MHAFFSTKRFIVLIALLMGLTAFGIDAVLPAFPEMTTDFSLPLAEENRIQQVVFMFMLGFALFQLPFGTLADVFGRKIILCTGIVIYIIASASVIFIDDFTYLLIARFMQGVGLAAPRVISLTVVRDVSSGRLMSKIMSFVMMVFIIIPVMAPAIGQVALNYGSWHNIFWLFVMMGSIALAWVIIDLPETLHAEHRSRFSMANIGHAINQCLTHKPTLIYLAMLGMLFAMLMIYISQSEQIFQRDVYALGDLFPLIFGITASGMVLASLLNSKLVMRLGMHKMVHYALIAMLVSDTSMLFATMLFSGKMPLLLFVALLMVHMFCYSILMPNLNSLILEPHAKIAGTASALVGSVMTIIGVAIAHFISGLFNGTLYPIAIGYISITASVFILNIVVCRITHHQQERANTDYGT